MCLGNLYKNFSEQIEAFMIEESSTTSQSRSKGATPTVQQRTQKITQINSFLTDRTSTE